MRLITITALIFVFPLVLFAQNKYYLTPDGNVRTETELKKIISKAYSKEKNIISGGEKLNIFWPDTLSYRDLFPVTYSNFGIYSRQIAVQWFVSPVPLKIKKYAICSYNNPDSANAELKIVKLNWSKSMLDTTGVRNWGYYPAENNGFNNITGFLDNSDRTGEWIDISGNNVPPPFAEDILSDAGLGAPITPNNPPVFLKEYQWVGLIFAMDIIVEAGEVFGVVMTNVNPEFTDSVNHRIGLFSADANLPPAFKFYPNGRYQTSTGADKGWWTVDITFDMALEVEFLWIDEFYEITNITNIQSPTSNAAQTIYADIEDWIPGSGVLDSISPNIVYRINNDLALFKIPMTRENEIKWKGEIPGQSNGTIVTYYIEIRDTLGNQLQRTLEEYTYSVFQPNLVENQSSNPEDFSLEQNFPNPFNPSTTISFNLPVESKVTLKIFDLLGQEIKTLIDNSLTAGNHQVKFNAGELNSGIYFYQIYASGIGGQEFKSGGKMMLIK